MKATETEYNGSPMIKLESGSLSVQFGIAKGKAFCADIENVTAFLVHGGEGYEVPNGRWPWALKRAEAMLIIEGIDAVTTFIRKGN